MKKKRKSLKKSKALTVLLLLLVFFSALAINCSAAGSDEILSDFSAIIPEKTPFSAEDTDGLMEAFDIGSVFSFIITELSGKRSRLISFFLTLLAVTVLSCLSGAIGRWGGSALKAGTSIISSSILLAAIYPVIQSVISSLKTANDFFSLAAPILCSVNLSGGAVSTAGVEASGMALTVAFVSAVSSRILPVIAVFTFALSVLSSFGMGENVAKGAKNLYNRLLGIVTLIISITLSLQTVIASAKDSAALRTVRYTAGSMIPIVGGTVSSALSTLTGGLVYIKDIIGTAAIGVILYIFLSPLAILLLYRLALSLAEIISDFFGGGFCLSAFSYVLDATLASYALCCMLYVVEIILFMRLGVVAV